MILRRESASAIGGCSDDTRRNTLSGHHPSLVSVQPEGAACRYDGPLSLVGYRCELLAVAGEVSTRDRLGPSCFNSHQGLLARCDNRNRHGPRIVVADS